MHKSCKKGSFQGIIILCGFLSSGFLVLQSFSDWNSAPVITTLDSIAAPIHDLQFPTVTACQNDKRPPDRWAYLENLMNLIAFECSGIIHAGCENTTKLRRDFKFLIDQIANDMKAWIMYNPKTKDSPMALLSYFPNVAYYGLENVIAEKVYTKEISLNALKNLPGNNLTATRLDVGSYLLSLMKISDDEFQHFKVKDCLTFNEGKQVVTKKCKNNVEIITRIIRWIENIMNIDSTQPFGSFVSTFSRAMKSANFDFDRKIKMLHNKDICRELKDKGEQFMNRYFASLSKSLGLEENETVSLFDIPTIFGDVDKVILENEDFPTIDQYFLFSMCEEDASWTFDKEYRCKKKMMDLALNHKSM